MKGKVKFYDNVVRHFGFIACDEGGDAFFKSYDIEETVTDGDQVEFDVIETDRGPRAKRIKKAKQ